MTKRSAAALDPFPARVGDRLAGAEVVGFDETGFRVAAKLHWVHVAGPRATR